MRCRHGSSCAWGFQCYHCTLHTGTYHVTLRGFSIENGCKPSQAIFVHIHPQRVTRCHQNIHSEIKLETINEEWLQERERERESEIKNKTHSRDVLLHNTVLSWFDKLCINGRAIEREMNPLHLLPLDF